MKPSSTAVSIPRPSQGWMLLTAFLALLFMTPMPGNGQEGAPPQGNPHGDASDPMLPPPGIIGVALHLTAERVGAPAGLFVRATHPLGPAAKAGIAHGQEVLAVDGTSVKGMTYREVVAIIRGEIGTPVTLLVKTFNAVKEVTIIRASEQVLIEEKHI